MDRRFRAVAIAVALAAIALTVVSQRRHSHSSVIGGPVTVLVARNLIQKGTTGNAIRAATGFYEVESFPRWQLQPDAIVDPAALVGKVAVRDIPAGAQLTAAEFVALKRPTPGARPERAVVVTRPKTSGSVTAGSHVDVWTSTKERPGPREIERDMRVLAVSAADGTVTLAATPAQAGRLIYAMRNTNHLTLRPRR
jgi:hypothetical protein